MPVRPCLGLPGQPCRRLANAARCPDCTAQREQDRGSATQRGYDADWRRLVPLVLERDGHVCHWCGGHATTGDHLIPLAEGGARLDPDNVVASCGPCNSARGGAMRGGRVNSLDR